MSQSQDFAETVGLLVLAWLTAQDELLPTFLGATGATEADVRAGAQDPEFLGAVLDFVLMDDDWVVAASEAAEIEPEQIAEARAFLPGGSQVHWT